MDPPIYERKGRCRRRMRRCKLPPSRTSLFRGGYKVYTWAVGSEGGPAAKDTRFCRRLGFPFVLPQPKMLPKSDRDFGHSTRESCLSIRVDQSRSGANRSRSQGALTAPSPARRGWRGQRLSLRCWSVAFAAIGRFLARTLSRLRSAPPRGSFRFRSGKPGRVTEPSRPASRECGVATCGVDRRETDRETDPAIGPSATGPSHREFPEATEESPATPSRMDPFGFDNREATKLPSDG